MGQRPKKKKAANIKKAGQKPVIESHAAAADAETDLASLNKYNDSFVEAGIREQYFGDEHLDAAARAIQQLKKPIGVAAPPPAPSKVHAASPALPPSSPDVPEVEDPIVEAPAAVADPDADLTALEKYIASFVEAGIRGQSFRDDNLDAAARAMQRLKKPSAPAPGQLMPSDVHAAGGLDEADPVVSGGEEDESATDDGENSDASTEVLDSETEEQQQQNALSVAAALAHQRSKEEYLRRVARREKFKKELAARPPVNLESLGQREDAANNQRVAEIEEILKKRSISEAGKASFGDRVVFFDLEWHKLDKKLPEETTKSYDRSLVTAHICQICAISANYSRRFNQYIAYRKLKPAWMRLVQEKVLELSPQDDPQIAISTEDAFDLLIDSFPSDCLFLSYGNTDAASIFKTLSAEGDYDQYNEITPLPPDRIKRRQDILAKLQLKKWRWANVMHFMKKKGRDLNFEKDHIEIAGGLGRLYDVLFHHSLWVSYPTPADPGRFEKGMRPSEIVESEHAKGAIESQFEEFPANLAHKDKFGLVPREWLEVKRDEMRNPEQGKPLHKNCFPQFWPTSHLEPVFHVAHTDTIMTINCVAMLCLASLEEFQVLFESLKPIKVRDSQNVLEAFRQQKGIPPAAAATTPKAKRYQTELIKNFADRHLRLVEANFNCLATSVIKQTWFFRKFQIALSEQSAQEIWDWYDTTHAPKPNSKGFWFKTTQEMRYRAYVLACKAIGRTPNKYDVGDYDVDLHGENYEVQEILDVVMITKKRGKKLPSVIFHVKWKDPDNKWGHREWWEPRSSLQNAAALLAEFEATLDASMRERIRVAEARLVPNSSASSVRSSASSSSSKTRDFVPEPAPKLASVYELEEAEEETVAEFTKKGKDPNTYFTIKQPLEKGAPDNYEELVMTKRKGKFTDKVKAIRRFLLGEAKQHKDSALQAFLVQKDVPFSEKRQIRFPLDPKKFYDGLPWFSLRTSVAEPRTEMLHTMDCRNLTDNRARTFADFEVFLWDFDIIVQQRIFLNTRFRFCKECKEYSDTLHPSKSSSLAANALLAKFGIRSKKYTTATVPTPIASDKRPASPIRNNSNSSDNSSSADSWVSGRMSRSSSQRLRYPQPGGYPLTNLVSYFAMRSSLADF